MDVGFGYYQSWVKWEEELSGPFYTPIVGGVGLGGRGFFRERVGWQTRLHLQFGAFGTHYNSNATEDTSGGGALVMTTEATIRFGYHVFGGIGALAGMAAHFGADVSPLIAGIGEFGFLAGSDKGFEMSLRGGGGYSNYFAGVALGWTLGR
jgi:hypothetical protein